ncbi:hypothetical protein NQ036_09945 [Brevibacterium sp. 91QC2O2]|jgi:hypothetical protein|uniref:hypothetical protein n=1 Tax=Brevibacterium sp. 91QC2O2 TaxID=2968458 RepID=UPI00211C9DB3|nr:hypothetical protein [Brevibacterium sp. 91QC2O2]MCQ9368556.1 hypothetical protein [Brevibacterium sp. 91QC2O2]
MATGSAQKTRDEIVAGVRAALDSMPDKRFEDLDDPALLGDRIARMLPQAPGAFSALIGPVYSTKALTSMWDISREAVSKKAKKHQLFAIKVEGDNLFPLFQFSGDSVRSDVLAVANVFREVVDPATIALWIMTPLAGDEQKRTPLGLLDNGHLEDALAAARRTARNWAA